MDMKKQTLVLGANGFIGSHLVDSLAQLGFQVVAFDRFSTDPQFAERPNVRVVRGDIFELPAVTEALQGVDFVIHAFSATTPYSADMDPYADIEKNLLHSARIFELCAQQKVKKVIYISSGGAIYGSSAENGRSARETDAALPISPYGIGKLAAERYLEYFQRKYGLRHVSYRLSNPYGPRQVTKQNQGVVPRFIENISRGETISLYGDGSSSRDYIYIEDAVRLISSTFEDCTQTVYNIGSGAQTSLSALIATLEQLLNKSAVIESVPEPPTFVHTSELDISRFTEEFDLRAELNFKDGIAKTIQYLRQQENT